MHNPTQLCEYKKQGALIVRCSRLERQPLACTNQRPILSMGGYRGAITLVLCLMLCLVTAQPSMAQDQQTWEVHLLKITKDYKEYKCVKRLIFKESSNNPDAKNGSHYGLPQGRTRYLASASPTAQVTWMMKYIRAKYQNGCNALKHSDQRGWY